MVLELKHSYKKIKERIAKVFIGHPKSKEILISCLCGLVLVITAFPEVIFMGGTLRLGDIDFHLRTNFNEEPINLLPVAPHRNFKDAQVDRAGAFLQSEPGMEFIRISYQNGESPFWNPYNATGAQGPETLVDNKFAIINWAYALMGGGQHIYDLIFLSAVFMAAACMHRFLRGLCDLSQPAAWAGAAIYIFNGYSIANLGSNVTWGFYFMPLCLLTCCRLVEQANPRRLATAAIALGTALSFTFMPTTVIGLLTVVFITLCYHGSHVENKKQFIKGIGYLFLAGILAFCLVAVIYLPIAENLLLDSTDVGAFNDRNIPKTNHIISLFSLLSSSHFFESYFAFEKPIYDAWRGLYASTVYHIGVAAFFLICFAFINKTKLKLHRFLCWGSVIIAILVLARIYGLPGYTWVISQIPIFGRFNTQYQWAGLMLPITILVAFGLNAITTQQIDKKILRRLLILIWGIIMCLGIAVYVTGRLNSSDWTWDTIQTKSLSIMAIFMFAMTFLIICITSIQTNFKKTLRKINIPIKNVLAWLIAVLLVVNLYSEFKTVYYIVPDLYAEIKPEVQFLKDNSGLHRTLGIGPFVSIQPEKNIAWEIYTLGSVNMAISEAYSDFFHNNINIDPSQRLTIFMSTELVHDTPELHDINIFALDMVGVKYLMISYYWQNCIEYFKEYGFEEVAYFSEPTKITVILENPNVWPRSFIIPTEYFNVENDLMLEPEMEKVLKPVDISSYHHTSVTLQGNAESDGIVVLTDNWHRNWSAQLNGEDVDIAVVHGTFRGVYVPKGDFAITMTYRPSTLNIAVAMTVTGCVICLLGLIVPKSAWGKLIKKRQTD